MNEKFLVEKSIKTKMKYCSCIELHPAPVLSAALTSLYFAQHFRLARFLIVKFSSSLAWSGLTLQYTQPRDKT